jgi:hypothetical protein
MAYLQAFDHWFLANIGVIAPVFLGLVLIGLVIARKRQAAAPPPPPGQ